MSNEFIESEYRNKLAEFVTSGDFQSAIEICNLALVRGYSKHFWWMQTAYISFLNERDDHSYFDVTILTLEQFITFYPHDSNAHFWLGYFRCVIQNNLTEAEKHLRCSLSILPSQPYANLVLSSLLGDSTQLLLRTLEVQPHNFRALSELAQLQINKRDFRGASKSVNTIIHAAPFVETDYFIMNKYVNDVLNGSSHVSSYREQAYNTLKQYNL